MNCCFNGRINTTTSTNSNYICGGIVGIDVTGQICNNYCSDLITENTENTGQIYGMCETSLWGENNYYAKSDGHGGGSDSTENSIIICKQNSYINSGTTIAENLGDRYTFMTAYNNNYPYPIWKDCINWDTFTFVGWYQNIYTDFNGDTSYMNIYFRNTNLNKGIPTKLDITITWQYPYWSDQPYTKTIYAPKSLEHIRFDLLDNFFDTSYICTGKGNILVTAVYHYYNTTETYTAQFCSYNNMRLEYIDEGWGSFGMDQVVDYMSDIYIGESCAIEGMTHYTTPGGSWYFFILTASGYAVDEGDSHPFCNIITTNEQALLCAYEYLKRIKGSTLLIQGNTYSIVASGTLSFSQRKYWQVSSDTDSFIVLSDGTIYSGFTYGEN